MEYQVKCSNAYTQLHRVACVCVICLYLSIECERISLHIAASHQRAVGCSPRIFFCLSTRKGCRMKQHKTQIQSHEKRASVDSTHQPNEIETFGVYVNSHGFLLFGRRLPRLMDVFVVFL